ncbi:hypothetical protein [Streptomyces sp. AC04842]|uniref:hypothetical protein n=1 Tax=Streptomyces sp. AC04842 TaxID=2775327 RepID=UPI0020C7319D
MDTTITAPRAEVLRDRYRSRLPKRLQELAGPVEGSVDLPLHIAWSGRTSYSLDRPKSRMTLYRTGSSAASPNYPRTPNDLSKVSTAPLRQKENSTSRHSSPTRIVCTDVHGGAKPQVGSRLA